MRLYFTLLFAGFCTLVQAQHTLHGRVTDADGLPLELVDIYSEVLQLGTSTNEAGEFQLKNLPGTPIMITVNLIGYEKITRRIHLTDKDTSINFTLQETVFKMGEILISTHFSRMQSENVMKVERASIDELKKKGGITLMQRINALQGLSQVSTGIGIGKPVIRGLRGNRVLVYNQGLRMENQQFGDEHGLGVNEHSIESIELIKGPASLLYGSDAMGGVLYFNPLRFAEINSDKVELGSNFSANTLGLNSFVNYKKSFDFWKFIVSAGKTEHSDYKTGAGQRIFNTRFNEDIVNIAVGYSNQSVSSTLRMQQSNSTIGIPEHVEEQSTDKTPELPFQEIQNQLISFKNVLFLNNSKISATLGYTQNKRKEFEDEHHDEHEEGHEEDHEEGHEEDHEEEHNVLHPALYMKLNTFTTNINWEFSKNDKYSTVIGFQHMHQKNKNFGEELLIPDATKRDIGFFATTILESGTSLYQGGIRYDTRNISTEAYYDEPGSIATFEKLDKDYNSISISLGMKTTFFKSIVSRINIASGFKAPTLSELSSNGVHHGANRYEIGNPNLKKEKNIQADIALEYQTDHFELFTNGFYNNITDYIFISPLNETIEETPAFRYEQGDARLYGGEFGMHFHPHPLDWLHVSSSYEMVIGKQKNGGYLPLIPAHKLTNIVRGEFNNTNSIRNAYVQLSLENFFEQNKVSEFESPSDGYQLVNLSAGGNFKFSKKINASININLNNAFDKKYSNHLSRLKPEGIYDIGRNFLISLKLSN